MWLTFVSKAQKSYDTMSTFVCNVCVCVSKCVGGMRAGVNDYSDSI